MELTWITFPMIVVTVSLLAYYAAYVVKGTELRVNKVDVVDVDVAGEARAGGRTFVNLFSPQNRDYDVAVVPLPLDRAAPADRATAAVRPPPGTEVAPDLVRRPRAGLRRHGQQRPDGLRRRAATATARSARPRSSKGVRVAIWSTKVFAARWFGPGHAPSRRRVRPRARRHRPADRDGHQPPAASPLQDADRSPSASRSTTTSARSRRARPIRVELTQDRSSRATSRTRYPSTSRPTLTAPGRHRSTAPT